MQRQLSQSERLESNMTFPNFGNFGDFGFDNNGNLLLPNGQIASAIASQDSINEVEQNIIENTAFTETRDDEILIEELPVAVNQNRPEMDEPISPPLPPVFFPRQDFTAAPSPQIEFAERLSSDIQGGPIVQSTGLNARIDANQAPRLSNIDLGIFAAGGLSLGLIGLIALIRR